MNQQRTQLYLQLIQELLKCPLGHESEVLQRNDTLIDEGFVQMISQVGKKLRVDGSEQAGIWLESLSHQLAQKLGLSVLEKTTDDLRLANTEKYISCLQALLKAEEEGDVHVVLQTMKQHVDSLDMGFVSVLRDWAQAMQTQRPESSGKIAVLIEHLSIDFCQFSLGSRANNLEIAIAGFEISHAIYAQENNSKSKARVTMNLALAYRDRIKGDKAQNIEKAIAAYQQALHFMTQVTMPVEWATVINNLATAYLYRIEGDRAENIEQAILGYEQALSVRTRNDMPVKWATTTNNLALAYSSRIKGNKAENVEKAISAYEQALQVTTRISAPVEWAATMMNLAIAYSNRVRGDRAENIEQAITAYEQALEIRTRTNRPIEWSTTTMNLAISYSERIRGDRAENIEQAIALYKQVLTVRTRVDMPADWSTGTMNLANAYSERIRGDREDNLEKAINYYEQAISVKTQTSVPVEWAQIVHNLANAYRAQSKGNRVDNIEKAIAAYRQALTVRTKKTMPVEWAETVHNLATAYYLCTGDDRLGNLQKALTAFQSTLSIRTKEKMPIEWAKTMSNLANVYAEKAREDASEERFLESINGVEKAIASYEKALEVFQPETLPNDCRRTARLLGNYHSEHGNWSKAISAYEKAIEAAEVLYQNSLLPLSKEAELANNSDLYRRASYAMAKNSELQKAVTTIEQGRARGLSDMLTQDRTDFEQLKQKAPSVYNRYETAIYKLREHQTRERLQSLTSASDSHGDTTVDILKRRQLIRREVEEAINDIRQVSSFEKFLVQPTFSDIATVSNFQHPLVYLNPTPLGTLALVVYCSTEAHSDCHSNYVECIWFDSFTETSLRELIIGSDNFSSSDSWFEAYDLQKSAPECWLTAIDQVTARLWQELMGGIVQYLEVLEIEEAVLIPSSYLVYLPLHAAWVEDSTTCTGRCYAIDTISFTYAPNARSLQTTKSIAQQTPATNLLAIDNPTQDLAHSNHEVAAAALRFPEHHILKEQQATRESVRTALENYSVIHFSCHGTVDVGQPINSGLHLSDDSLTLYDLLSLKMSGIRLAVLSACETGMPGAHLPDEVISLPMGLLQAGVAGVVSSLWPVSELSTMILLSRFYSLWRGHNVEPASALVEAQQWIRDADPSDIVNHCKAFIPELSTQVGEFSKAGQSLYRMLRLDYSHPYYWAAFTYTGV